MNRYNILPNISIKLIKINSNIIILYTNKNYNKIFIKKYMEYLYNIKIKSINTLIFKNKKKVYLKYETL